MEEQNKKLILIFQLLLTNMFNKPSMFKFKPGIGFYTIVFTTSFTASFIVTTNVCEYLWNNKNNKTKN